MSKLQLAVVGGAVLLLLALYFGFSNKPKERAEIDRQRTVQANSMTPDKLLKQAEQVTPPQDLARILTMETALDSTQSVDKQADILKNISSAWNNLGNFALGGLYAEEVARLIPSDSAWAIAGSTYFSGFRFSRDSAVANYCIAKSIESFENAISLAPGNIQHRLNLGLCFVEGSQQPMKGIMMIRDLLEKDPENTMVLYTLGRLSIRSGQYDKAIQRFEQVIQLDPDQVNARYLLAQCYRESGQLAKAVEQLEESLKRTNDEAFQQDILNLLNELKK